MDTIVDTNDTPVTSTEEILKTLKAKADSLDIKYNARIGADTLQDKILTYEAEQKERKAARLRTQTPESKAEQIIRIRQEASRLRRVVVTCLDPSKRNWPGEIISVGNGKIGLFKKYVPFDVAEGYHIPNIIYNMLKQRKCQIMYKVKGRDGKPDSKRSKLINAFSVPSTLTNPELN